MLDGPVARKTGQVTDAGKILDAAAHKIMHYTLVILLVPGYHWLWLLLILMMLRDLTEIMCGYLLFSRYDRVYSSRWFGRLVTIALYAVPGLIMAWTGMPRLTADALIIACAGLVLHAFFMQIRAYLKVEWGTQYRTYSSEVIRTITMSIWVMIPVASASTAAPMNSRIGARNGSIAENKEDAGEEHGERDAVQPGHCCSDQSGGGLHYDPGRVLPR